MKHGVAMRVTARRVHALIGLTLLALVSGAAILPPPPDTLAGANHRAIEWVAANRANLPRTFDALVAQPLLVRRAILPQLSVAERNAIWIRQFEAFVLPDSQLSQSQKRK